MPTDSPATVLIQRKLQESEAQITLIISVLQSHLGGYDSYGSYLEANDNFNIAAASGNLVTYIKNEAIARQNQDFGEIYAASNGSYSNLFTDNVYYPTLRPTGPSRMPTNNPNFYTPRPNPPSFAPSYQDAPYLRFVVSIILHDAGSSELSYGDEMAIQNATARALQTTSDHVMFDDYAFGRRRRLLDLLFAPEAYRITTNSTVTVDLIDYGTTDPDSLYSSLNATFSAAVESGLFVQYLTSAATEFGASATLTVTKVSYVFYAPFVIDVPTFAPTEVPTESPSTHAPVSFDTQVRFATLVVSCSLG